MICPRCEWRLVRAEDDGAECTNPDCSFPYSRREEEE
jgi:hypothetical protein